MERKIPCRTMKENSLEEENYQIRKIRRQVNPIEEYRRRKAVDILSSSEIAKAVISKTGKIPEATDEKPSCYGHYFDNAPTLKKIEELGCLKCTYWTYEDDSCLLVSIKEKARKQNYKSR